MRHCYNRGYNGVSHSRDTLQLIILDIVGHTVECGERALVSSSRLMIEFHAHRLPTLGYLYPYLKLFSFHALSPKIVMLTLQIIVNSFTFCATHGDEYCQECGVDHRMTNNAQVEDDLSKLEDVFEIGLEVRGNPLLIAAAVVQVTNIQERQPINVYARGATAAVGAQGSFECIIHGAADCSICFSWVMIIEKEAREAAELGSWLERRLSSTPQQVAT